MWDRWLVLPDRPLPGIDRGAVRARCSMPSPPEGPTRPASLCTRGLAGRRLEVLAQGAPAELPVGRRGASLGQLSGHGVELHQRGPDALVVTEMVIEELRGLLAEVDPAITIFGFGRAIEVFKGVGPAHAVCDRYGVDTMSGYQAVGHTRMATESAVTIAHSHPFCPAADLALVHNGSFSNYASLRRELEAEGVFCDTDNDSEVAARFVAAEMLGGASLEEALRGVLKRFDGFFTLLVTTEREFAIVQGLVRLQANGGG